MLSDNELRGLRRKKKQQDALDSVDGRIALNAPKKKTPRDIERELEPWTKSVIPKLPEALKPKPDPAYEKLKAGGYID